MNLTIALDHDWIVESLPAEPAQVYRQTFELAPLDYCARYLLHIDGAASLRVRLRGEVVAEGEGPLQANVTDYLSLDDNVLEVGVRGADTLGNVWLEAVPCDEVTL